MVGYLFEQVKLNWLPQLTQMVFDDWIDFQDPLVLGHVPLLKALSLTYVTCSFHKMVKLNLGAARMSNGNSCILPPTIRCTSGACVMHDDIRSSAASKLDITKDQRTDC
ncbi:uncharacterized protein LOC124696009 [Lolium rigidum]|uniref:uncharacterized protein LOC124696009 n=1 Tax=Lolium rigidum TaxID=89674 RepID=UPI001F5D1578|nr:uncharacterized protein LOC124696009 [Lolium rigidum]